MKYLSLFVSATIIFALKTTAFDGVKIPLGGNAFVTRSAGNIEIGNNGIVNWDNENATVSCWFKTSHGGKLSLSVQARVTKGTSKIMVSVNEKSTELDIKNTNWETLPAGSFDVPENEYVRVDLKGISKTGPEFGEISDFIIEGEAAAEPLVFVREPENFYFGRRGPSVHLSYEVPENAGNIEYFYNEIKVPEGEDVIGSYFMVNGFAEGYCGIQVNSDDERRILFSVWSPFETDNPDQIPAEAQVRLLARGDEVVTKEFGGEGSGGQSFLRYHWKAGLTYRFLTRVHPDENRAGATVYTTWFFAPEQNKWRLIASFSRPQKVTWYKRPHSFLENFIPSQGHLARQVEFGNQWVIDEHGNWGELTRAKFTFDATAKANRRADFDGGVSKTPKTFYLKNCGLFNSSIQAGTFFNREKSGIHPEIDFGTLPDK
jgi:hypothetical protein